MGSYVQIGERKIPLDGTSPVTGEDRDLLQQHFFEQWHAYVDGKQKEAETQLPQISPEDSRLIQGVLLLWRIMCPHRMFPERKKHVIRMNEYTCEYVAYCNPRSSVLSVLVKHAGQVIFEVDYHDSPFANGARYSITRHAGEEDFLAELHTAVLKARGNHHIMMSYFEMSTPFLVAFCDILE